jgi:hypothetical protein
MSEESNHERRRAAMAGRVIRLLYTGKSGVALPLRIAQGALAGFVTLALLATVFPHQSPRPAADTASMTGSGSTRAPETVPQASGPADQKTAVDKAAAEAAARRTGAAKAAAQRAAAQKALAAQAAAREAAARKTAADRAAAEAAARAAQAAAVGPQQGGGCTAAYPDFCIPELSGDAYNCSDFSQKGFTALAPDPYRLDRDNDGIACES